MKKIFKIIMLVVLLAFACKSMMYYALNDNNSIKKYQKNSNEFTIKASPYEFGDIEYHVNSISQTVTANSFSFLRTNSNSFSSNNKFYYLSQSNSLLSHIILKNFSPNRYLSFSSSCLYYVFTLRKIII